MEEHFRANAIAGISHNRQWIAYAARNKLFITDLSQQETTEYDLPAALTGLAIADNGRRIAIVATRGCTGIIDLPSMEQGGVKIEWLGGFGRVDDYKGFEPCTDENVKASWLGDMFLPPQAGVALSSDGSIFAGVRLEDDGENERLHAQVVDLTNKLIINLLPLQNSYSSVQLEFVDKAGLLISNVSADSSSALSEINTLSDIHVLWDFRKAERKNVIYDKNAKAWGTIYNRALGKVISQQSNGVILQIDPRKCNKASSTFIKRTNEIEHNIGRELLTVGANGAWYAVGNELRISVYRTADNSKFADFDVANNIYISGDIFFLSQGATPNSLVALFNDGKQVAESPSVFFMLLPDDKATNAKETDVPISPLSQCKVN